MAKGPSFIVQAVKVHDMVFLGITVVRSLHAVELSVLCHYNINMFDEKGVFL